MIVATVSVDERGAVPGGTPKCPDDGDRPTASYRLAPIDHARFTVDTGVAVYFCDPRSPWQRGSNENTNGLLRQYLPRHVNLRDYSQDDLEGIAAELNGRPRQTLGFKTPSEALADVLR